MADNSHAAAWRADFSYSYYRRLLEACAESHTVQPLCEFAPGDAAVAYLRHDIDVSLDAALALARAEAAWGFRSTYMFIPTSSLYSLASPDARAQLREIADLGHEVALHLDVVASGVTETGYGPELKAAVRAQAAALAEMTDLDIRSVSFHRPHRDLLQGPDRFAGLICAYGASLTPFYKSDSKGVWRDGEPIAEVRSAAPDTPVMQILTHPIWWGEDHAGAEDRLEAFFQNAVAGESADVRKRLDANIRATIGGVTRRGATDTDRRMARKTA